MNKITLTADSGICAIPKEDTKIIPAQIIPSIGDSFPDNGYLTNEEILKRMQTGISFKTSSPLIGDYEDAFIPILEQGNDIIHLSMSSGISEGSLNASNTIANILNNEYKNKVYIIDSLTGASGGTLLFELAYKEIINSNLPTEKIVEKLNELKTKIKTSFYVPNIDGFIRSGRNKTSSHLKDSALNATSYIAKAASFKFRVNFHENGDLYLKKIFRSNDSQGMEKMTMDIVNEKNINTYEKDLAVIGNLHQDKVNMEKIKEYLLSFKYFTNVIIKDIGAVVAPYGCNDLCGIALVKKRQN